jgi:hypothetical protein
MNAKLLVTIDQSVIEKDNPHAKKKDRSLSDDIEIYLKVITADEFADDELISPTVQSLKGLFKVPDTFDYKKELIKGLTEKYYDTTALH